MKLGALLTRTMIEPSTRCSRARHLGGFDVGSIITCRYPCIARTGLGASGDRLARAGHSANGATRLQSCGYSIRVAPKGV